MYIPDWSFEQRLMNYDDKLSVKWNSASERWTIYREIPSRANLYERSVPIMQVQNQDKSYRPLDQRTLNMLANSDHHRRGANVVLDELVEAQERQEKIDDKDFMNDAEAITKDAIPAGGFEDDYGAVNVPKEDLVPEDKKHLY